MFMIFLTALAVAFSGAMMPGPLLTYTIKQSLNTGAHSGFVIISGHAIMEIILIALIFMDSTSSSNLTMPKSALVLLVDYC